LPTTDLREIARARLDALLRAWASADIGALSGMLCEDVVFASPFTESVDEDGLLRGRDNVLARLAAERLNFYQALEIIDVMVGSTSMVVLLTCGPIKLSCLIELDDQARFRRMIAAMGHVRPH
jgi:hypothetical protein